MHASSYGTASLDCIVNFCTSRKQHYLAFLFQEYQNAALNASMASLP